MVTNKIQILIAIQIAIRISLFPIVWMVAVKAKSWSWFESQFKFRFLCRVNVPTMGCVRRMNMKFTCTKSTPYHAITIHSYLVLYPRKPPVLYRFCNWVSINALQGKKFQLPYHPVIFFFSSSPAAVVFCLKITLKSGRELKACYGVSEDHVCCIRAS